MITGELKNKIDGLWDIFASGGLVNPLDVIEQITYLMFIHDLSINKYKETEYVPVEYPSTAEIMADLRKIEMEITKGLAELEEMINE